MMPGSATLPTASVHHSSLWRRLVTRLLKPPRWAATPDTWSLSAATAAAALHLLSLLIADGRLSLLYELSLSPGQLVFSLICFAAMAMALYGPLRWSEVLYFLLLRKQTRRSAVVWTVSFHLIAHMALLGFLRAEPFTAVHVPLIIGSLWGLWLHRTHDDRRERDLRHWMTPSGCGR